MASKNIAASNITIKRQSGTNNVYVTWSLSSAQQKIKITKKVYNTKKKKAVSTTKTYYEAIDYFTVKWYYRVTTSDSGTWYLDKALTKSKSTGTISTSDDLWNVPDIAKQIRVVIKPISKKYRSSKSATAAWFSVDSTGKNDKDFEEIPEQPSIGDFTIKDMKVRAVITYKELGTSVESLRIQMLKDGVSFVKFGDNTYKTVAFDNSKNQTIFETTLREVGSYQIRAKIAAIDSGNYRWSEYCAWSSSVDTRPQAPTNVKCTAIAADKIKVSWDPVDNIDDYEIEYVKDKIAYFDSGMVSSTSVKSLTSYIINGLDGGGTWYFRVRSVNSADRSDPSKIAECLVATKPEAPTTWSSTTNTAITNDVTTTNPLYLYWVHNTADGSVDTKAQIIFNIAGTNYYRTIENTKVDEYGELVNETREAEMWNLDVYLDENNTRSAGKIHAIFSNSSADTIRWKVRTLGVHPEYSDWSVERPIKAYIKPNLEITVTDDSGASLDQDILRSFPLFVSGLATPASQTPISYYISIVAEGTYSSVDGFGNDFTVVTGTEIFGRYLDTNEQLRFTLNASDIDFEPNVAYTLKVVVYMNSGLTAEASCSFTPIWEETGSEPDADITYNDEYKYCDIRPFASYYLGEDVTGDYDPTVYIGTKITGNNKSPVTFTGSGITNARVGDLYLNTSTGGVYACLRAGVASTATWAYKDSFIFDTVPAWYSGTAINGESDDDIYPQTNIVNSTFGNLYVNDNTGDIYRCVAGGGPSEAMWSYLTNVFWGAAPDTILGVYRREANGSYVKIAEGIDNSTQMSGEGVVVRDLHPSFGACVYRIIATNTKNGGIGFTDIVENYDETSIVIQWDEVWKDTVQNEDGEYVVSNAIDDNSETFKGSILELPANIKLADKNNKDVVLAEYIGRSRPVSYYGTQKGESASISCVFDKTEVDRLEMVRRLMAYPGDVYIREPSGLGYWANVTVNYNRDYDNLTIPVSIDVKPVEGGV